MSSAHLSSQDGQLAETLLTEFRSQASAWSFGDEAAAGALLTKSLEEGIRDKDALRQRLRDHAIMRAGLKDSLGEWENEGGAPASPDRLGDYGRRIESDGTWSVYEVFTGREAQQRGLAPSGLTKDEALDRLIRFSEGGSGATDNELRAANAAAYSFWRRQIT
ncbi:MAG: hypothetical protein ACT6RL_21800 [Neoaquamicrobium sediminum]|uniref:hypothetical protein n=1 Tax=Hyphomicrobiales TaxID=356 RepID=UPI0040355AE3